MTTFFSRFPDAQAEPEPPRMVSIHASTIGHGFLVFVWTLMADGIWEQHRPEKRPTFSSAISLVPLEAIEAIPRPDFALRIFMIPARGNS